MAWVLHRKTTAVMATSYAAFAAVLFYLIADPATLAAVLFVLFALVLLAGNVYLRRAARGSGRLAGGDGKERASRAFSPGAAPRDPELGRP